MGLSTHRSWGLRSAGLVCALLVGACDMAPPVDPVLKPPERPVEVTTPAPPALDIARPSAQSQALRTYYRKVMNDRLTYGLLRTDGGGIDTPFSADMLLRNFEQIAFFDEYVSAPGSGRGGASPLRRWASPVRIEARFGASVDPATRTRDGNALTAYAARLGRITKHPISATTGAGANFHVFIVSEDDRADAVRQIRALEPSITPDILNAIANLKRNTYCLVVAFPRQDSPYTYRRAVAVIRAEHPDLMRLSCIHEEVAQGLGLANDSPSARPSIFNDDDEFALLTTHDEQLLSILYDPRLSPGMTAGQARETVRKIATEKVGGSS